MRLALFSTWFRSAVPRLPQAMDFAWLFMVESMARATLATVISVQAYDLLKDGQKVSVLFMGVGLVGLLSTLLIPQFLARFRRRHMYVAGVWGLALASFAFSLHDLTGQMLGMVLRVIGAALLSITLQLYILDNVRRVDLVRSEPLRLALSTASWTIGPYFGVWLYTAYGPAAPQAMAIFWSFVLLILFYGLGLPEGPPRRSRSRSPFASVGRFIAQPRLRLAWMIAFARSCFWTVFFTYAPLLMVTSGMGAQAGGLLVSLGNISLVSALWFGRMAQGVGVRIVIAAALVGSGVLSIAAGFSGIAGVPILAAVFLWFGSVSTSALDGVGSIPFLRAVRVHERAEMSGVYRSYLDLSDLLPNVIFSFVLLVAPLPIVFTLLGIWLLTAAFISWRYLPRSM